MVAKLNCFYIKDRGKFSITITFSKYTPRYGIDKIGITAMNEVINTSHWAKCNYNRFW